MENYVETDDYSNKIVYNRNIMDVNVTRTI